MNFTNPNKLRLHERFSNIHLEMVSRQQFRPPPGAPFPPQGAEQVHSGTPTTTASNKAMFVTDDSKKGVRR
jgi:hypothetical protein